MEIYRGFLNPRFESTSPCEQAIEYSNLDEGRKYANGQIRLLHSSGGASQIQKSVVEMLNPKYLNKAKY